MVWDESERPLVSHKLFPTANFSTSRVMNFIALLVTFVNSATMALLAVSTVAWSGTIEVTRIYGVVALMHLLVLLGELRQNNCGRLLDQHIVLM